MSQTIKLKRGTTTPTTSNIVSGEVAIDTSAKKLYINDAGTIKEIGGTGTISVSDIPSLPASKITSGSFDAARIPSLPASRITSGTFAAARIPSLAASKITSGTFDAARIPTLDQYVKTAGDTMTGNLVVEDSEIHVGDTSGDNWTRIKHAQADGYGFDWQHNNATVLVNEQGSTNEALVLGDVDAGNYSGLFGISHTTNSGTNWTKKLDLRGNGDLFIGSSGTSKVFHDGYHPNADKWTTARTITLGGDLSGSVSLDGSANVTLSGQVSNDSHTHAFNNLTGKTSGQGDYSTNGDFISGRGSGGVALTINDGYGNANVTFNHQNGVPEQAGQSARIEVNTDSTTSGTKAQMYFEGSTAPVTANSAVSLTTMLMLTHNDVFVPTRITHLADNDTYIAFDPNRIRLYAGGTVKFDSNNTYLTSAITSVQEGNLIDVSTNGGTAIVNVDLSEATDMTQAWDNNVDEFIVLDNGSQKRKRSAEIFGSNAFNSTTIPAAANNATITISAGASLTGGGSFTTNQGTNETITINHQDTSSQASVNNSGNTVIQDITLDTNGHITGITSKALSIPSAPANATITINAGTDLTGGGNFTTNQSSNETITINHEDVSSQGSVNNSGGTVIQGVTLNANGHVTALGSVDLDSRYLQSVPNLAASKITSGTFADARIPSLNASKITAGTFNSARIPEFLEEKYIFNSNDSNGVFMPMVKGGLYATTASTVTGGIKVVLPAYKSNMMFTIYVDIFEYTTGETCTFRVSGYAYNDSGATWHNCSVVAITDNNRDYNVRFYSDTANSQQYFTIGETNSTWSYPQVTLRDFWGGYSTSEAEAQGTWNISFVTSFSGTLRHTFSDNLPYADWDRLEGKPSFATVATSGSYNDLSNKPSIPSAPANATITIAAGASLTGGGNFTTNQSSNETITINHQDTSSQGSVNNSGNTVIQDVTLDTNGHVTGLTSKSLSIPAAANNATITLSAGTGLSGGGDFTTNQSSAETLTFNLTTPADAPQSWQDVVAWNGSLIKDTAVEIHGAGYLRAAYLNMSHGQSTRNSDSIFFSSTDSYIRKNTAAGMRSSLDLYTKGEVDALIPTVPSVGNGTMTITAGTSLTGGGSFTANQSGNTSVTINHADTSSQASVNNSGNTVIQDITLDTHGHITGITSKALSIPNSTDFVNVTSTQAISGFKRFNGNLSVADSVQHEGDSDTKIDFTTNRVRIYAGNSVKFDTNNTYLTSNSNITTGNITTYTSNGDTSTAQVNVGRGGGITFYGGAQTNHSIMSRDASGTISDDIRINSYGAVNINLDSNSNNTSSADFAIGHHGGGTGTITNLFTISGETGQVKAKDGTSSAPIYSFSSDTNLGLFRYGSDSLGITAGGTRRARFGSSIFLEADDVRINQYLYHNGDTNTYMRYTGDRIRFVAGGLTFIDMVEGATDYLRFNQRGVSIGSNTAPQATLTIDQGSTSTPANGCGTDRSAHIKLENTNTTGDASTCIIFNAKDSGGNMRHGAGIQFKKAIAWSANGQYPGELYFWTRPTSGNQAAAQKLDKDGNAIFKGNVTAYGSLSDRRLKENIEPITDAVAKVEQLEGVTFDYKKDGRRSTGLIAQDLEEVLPEAVYTTTEVEGTEEHKAIHYGNTVGLLVNAIKEQQQTINQLTKRIEELENGNH